MTIKKIIQNQFGYSLVEILISISLLGLLLPIIFSSIFSTQVGKVQSLQRTDASNLMLETSEIIRVIRESDWDLIASNGSYHPVVSGSSWVLAAGADIVGDFSREVIIEDVFRDSGGSIVGIGGQLDPSSKKVTITISWANPLPSSASTSMFFTRYLDNLSFEHTTQADFDAGTHQGTTVTTDDDGEVILAAGGHGNWCEPFDEIVEELDLPGQGEASAISVVEGRAVVGTGANSSGISLGSIAISNDNPPVAELQGIFDGYKTNDIFNESNYAYIATDDSHKEVIILDTNTNPPSEIGYFNAPSSNKADSLTVVGNTGYVTSGDYVYNFDLSSKTGERPGIDIDGTPLEGKGTSMQVVGNHAFITTLSSNTPLRIVDISNPNNLNTVGFAQPNDQGGRKVVVNETATRAYMITKSAGEDEFFIIDVSDKNGNRPILGSYDTGDMDPQSLAIASGNRAIVVGLVGEEYQVVDISSESNPSRCGGLDLDIDLNDIGIVLEADGDAYSYILASKEVNEFQVIRGGPGGELSSDGTFTSEAFDAGHSSFFNRFDASRVIPVNTQFSIQVAVADPIDNNCNNASYSFVGPDGSPDTSFDASGIIPFSSNQPDYQNPGQCFRYQVNFESTDSSSTPIFQDILVNYSP